MNGIIYLTVKKSRFVKNNIYLFSIKTKIKNNFIFVLLKRKTVVLLWAPHQAVHSTPCEVAVRSEQWVSSRWRGLGEVREMTETKDIGHCYVYTIKYTQWSTPSWRGPPSILLYVDPSSCEGGVMLCVHHYVHITLSIYRWLVGIFGDWVYHFILKYQKILHLKLAGAL